MSWKSKKQTTVARSSAEAEYRVIAPIVFELLWLSYVLDDLKVKISYPIQLYCDNQTSIHILENPVLYERTKHINIDFYFIRTHCADGSIQLVHISSSNQVVDIFTKAVGASTFYHMVFKLNLGIF